jgi:4-amino-4-deoxy-L-arabinose transferase-like glycosyltransferase
MNISKPAIRDIAILLLVCGVAFWWHLGKLGLIDPDEPFYAQTAREMVNSHDWLTPQIFGKPQFEKPILYYWLVAGSFKMFGENEFSGRLPSALPATLAVFMVYWFGLRVFGRRTGFLSALVLATGLEYSLMARLMLTDIVLAMFFAGAVFSVWMAMNRPERRNAWMISHLIFGALAVLTKGPIGCAVPLMATTLFLYLTKRSSPFRGAGFWGGAVVYGAIIAPWYCLMFLKHGWKFWDEFFVRDNFERLLKAEHPSNNHFFYYIAVLLVGSIPWLPLVAATAWRGIREARRDERQLFLWCWILTSFVFLTIAQSKLPSYIFYLFVPLALLAGTTLNAYLENGIQSAVERRILLGGAVLQFAATLVVPFVRIASPFAVPALLVGVCLGAGLVLQYRRHFPGWIAATVLANFALLASALTFASRNVEMMSSAKPIAMRILELRRDSEPVLGSKYLVRGIYYYLQNIVPEPVRVISDKAQPFWAEHPLEVVVWKGKNESLREFLQRHKSALFAVRKSNWTRSISRPGELAASCKVELVDELGDHVIVRASDDSGTSAPTPLTQSSSTPDSPQPF